MTLEVLETPVDAVKGETNIWDLDATVAVDAAQDKIWFTAKYRKSDPDADAVLQYGLNVAGLSGIVVTDGAAGQFRVTSPKADLEAVEGRALVYDCKLHVQATGIIQTIATGLLYLVESVNKDAT